MRGKIISIEGGDRVGKHTQSLLLQQWLIDQGLEAKQFSFPNYGKIQTQPVESYLAGKFGNLDPMESSILYAFDRSVTLREEKIDLFLNNGGWIVFDRYVQSNMMYQTARTIPDDVDPNTIDSYDDSFIKKLSTLEFDILGLPQPDMIIYLDLDRKFNDLLLDKDLGKGGGDIHERNHSLLDKASIVGSLVARDYGWNRIICNDENGIFSIQTIHNEIVKNVEKLFS